MKVKDVMTATPYSCRPEANLGMAAEYMWNGNCGFLPVVDLQERVVGVITDRDICIALATRNRPAGAISVSEVMARKIFSCFAEDDVHAAMRTMQQGQVRRLPVLARDGRLVGVISLDDIICQAEPRVLAKEPELNSEEVIRTCKAINRYQVPQAAFKRVAAA